MSMNPDDPRFNPGKWTQPIPTTKWNSPRGRWTAINREATQAAQEATVDARTNNFSPINQQVLSDAVKAGVEAAFSELNNNSSISSGYGSGGRNQGTPSNRSRGFSEGTVNGSGKVSNYVGRKLSELGRTAPSGQTPFAPRILNDSNGSYFMNPDGTKNRDSSLISKYASRGKVLDAVKGAVTGTRAGAMASGGTEAMLSEGLEAAAEFMPEIAPVAAVVGAVAAASQFASSQRSKNAAYQSVLGGSNASGFGQRFSEEGFRLSNLFDMSSGQAAQIFQGTTNLGLSGGLRNNANSDITKLYNNIGMSVSQSLQAVSVAASSGNKELTNLVSSLESVSQTAEAVGINAANARQQYISNYAQIAQGGVTGPNAASLAAAATNATLGMGSQYAGVNVSGLSTNIQAQTLIAASTGQSFNQYLAQTNGPGGTIVAGQDQQAVAIKLLKQIYGSSFTTLQNIALKYVKQAHAGGYALTNLYSQMGNDLLKATPNIPIYSVIQTLTSYGITGLNNSNGPGTIMGFIASTVSNTGINLASSARNASISGSSAKVSSATSTAITNDLNGTNKAVGGAVYDPLNKNQTAQYKQILSSINVKNYQFDSAQTAYVQDIVDKGKTDPILASLIKDPASRNSLYEVMVNGKPKVVNMEDLTKYFSAQVEAGAVTVATGQYAGKNVQDIANIKATAKSQRARGANNTTLSSAELKSLKTYSPSQIKAINAANMGGGSKSSTSGAGTITVKATPYLQKLFAFAVNENVPTNGTSVNSG